LSDRNLEGKGRRRERRGDAAASECPLCCALIGCFSGRDFCAADGPAATCPDMEGEHGDEKAAGRRVVCLGPGDESHATAACAMAV
jgi:hypothetical protein